MTPTFSGLVRSLLDRARVMFSTGEAVAIARSLVVGVRKEARPARGELVYLAWCGHW